VARIVKFLRRLPPADNTEDVDGEAVLRAIESQHGLIIERAYNIFSFSHLTFHEHFAAHYIAAHPESGILRGAVAHAADTRWREVLLLTASMLDYRNVTYLFRTWCEELQQQIQNEAQLISLTQWATRQGNGTSEPYSISIRATGMMMALIHCGFIYACDLARALTYARGRTRELARDLARDLSSVLNEAFNIVNDIVRDLASVLDVDDTFDQETGLEFVIALDGNVSTYNSRIAECSRTIERAYDIATTRALEHALEFDLVRNLLSNLALTLQHIHSLNRIESKILNNQLNDIQYDSILRANRKVLHLNYWYRFLQHAEYIAFGQPISPSMVKLLGYKDLTIILNHLYDQQFDVLLIQELLSLLPNINTKDSAAWNTFAVMARKQLTQSVDLGHSWNFTSVQLEVLKDYLASTERLLECLDLAVVEDRDAILSCLLILRSEPADVGSTRTPPN
jgi:hypothetical protein